jgi:long-chain acyl-CoA synthetase
VTHSPDWPARLGTVGLPLPGVELRIATPDAAASAPPVGQAGEVLIRGPMVMRGYWNRPEASAAAVDAEGWFATGDIGAIDDAGYLTIIDRKKDLIITAGYNVYPAEIEQALATHPAVEMVAVAGFPDAEKGELAHAFVVCRRGLSTSEAELIAYSRERLAAYKRPRVIHFVDELPRTSSGKLLRRALAALLPKPE